ncbi:MAG: MaoC/PaaZ C-terminal domain-containing protein, partial [Hyphomicrobium sp.]
GPLRRRQSGDVNPAYLDEAYAKTGLFHRVIAHRMWGGALISAVIGTDLPGPGTIYLDQTLSFRQPAGIGYTVTVRITVRKKEPSNFEISAPSEDGNCRANSTFPRPCPLSAAARDATGQ